MSTTTTRTGNNTNEARFLAPETHQRARDQLPFAGSPCSGINGRLPAIASLRRVPSIYSTVPLRPRFIAALLVSHGDRRMGGRSQLNTAPNAEGSTAESGSLGN